MHPIWRARAMWWGELQNKPCINRLASTLIFGMSLGARFHQGITTTNIILYPTGQNYYSWEFMFAKFEIARNHLWGMTNIFWTAAPLGFKPMIFYLQVRCSTTELYSLLEFGWKKYALAKHLSQEYRGKTTPSPIFMPCNLYSCMVW